MKLSKGLSFLWAISSSVSANPVLEKVSELMMAGGKITNRGDLGNVVFGADNFATHDFGETDIEGAERLKTPDSRKLGDGSTMCVDERDFFFLSQRYVLALIVDRAGVDINPLGEFDECSWFGVRCNDGIVTQLSLRGVKAVNQGGEYFPPQEIYFLQYLESLDLSNNDVLAGKIPDSINMLDDLGAIMYTNTLLEGVFNCTDTRRIIQFGDGSKGICNCESDACYNSDTGTSKFKDIGKMEDIMVFGTPEEGGFKKKGDERKRDLRQLWGKLCHVPKIMWYRFSQRYALQELYFVTGFAGVSGFNECEWGGVTCYEQVVTKIELNGKELNSFRAVHTEANKDNLIAPKDILPDSLLYLEFLEILDLGNNPFLIGKLPSNFDDLDYLRYLDVTATQIRGNVECSKSPKIVAYGGNFIFDAPIEILFDDEKPIDDGFFTGICCIQLGLVQTCDNCDKIFEFIKPDDNDRWKDAHEGDLAANGNVRFGLKCGCGKDTCIFDDTDIKVKPYDNRGPDP